MAGQGATTRLVAKTLSDNGWIVVYKCIPNTPHTSVVPIPTPNGTSNQRYPDVLAYRSIVTRLVEVEIALTKATAFDIIKRFGEMIDALNNTSLWSSWKSKIETDTGHKLPELFSPKCDLVLCNQITAPNRQFVGMLEQHSISVYEIGVYRS